MADPISLMAVAGLVYAGRTLAAAKATPTVAPPEPMPEQSMPPLPVRDSSPVMETTFAPRIAPKVAVNNLADITPQKRFDGSEISTFRNRVYDTGRMNNLSPVEKQLVGPGLGVDANTPATGGFQQMFRVNPVNVGEYKLTTLPGRTGPAVDITGGRSAVVGELTHNKPETTTYLPGRLPTVLGRAQGMTGVAPRQEHEKTKRTTNRSETGLRTDGLGFNGAKRVISAQTMSQDPTRFRSDRNDEHYKYHNQPQPGISNFKGAYENSAALRIAQKNNEELMKYGFRPEDRRGKPNRMGNAGRMNVRENALKQGGRLTSVRSDTSRIDGRLAAANGAGQQQYQQAQYHKFNAYKGNENPNSQRLDLAQRQLKNNPYAHSLAQ